MKTETEVTVRLADIRCSEHLAPEPDGFIIKAFLACSRTDTRPFRLSAEFARIDQTLRVANIGGRELEFWLCSTRNKIIVALPPLRPTPPCRCPTSSAKPTRSQSTSR